VFCNIDPSHVRRQTGSYEMAFARYEGELTNSRSLVEKVSEWKAALTSAANISGWDC
ncbi:TMV resistance protein N-like, partial [Trifolium medium]|nr:TMV resistance protein N-like [Trifolium medium]